MQCSRNVRTFEEPNSLVLTTEQRPSETSAQFYHPIVPDTPDGTNDRTNHHGNLQCHKTVTDSKARLTYVVGPCHHGMARPQVADRGTASDKEGSCE